MKHVIEPRATYEYVGGIGQEFNKIVRPDVSLAGDAEFPVGLIGSVFKAGAVFVEPLTRVVHGCAPHARVAPVEMAPVGGSLLLAAKAAGRGEALEAAQLAKLVERALEDGPGQA